MWERGGERGIGNVEKVPMGEQRGEKYRGLSDDDNIQIIQTLSLGRLRIAYMIDRLDTHDDDDNNHDEEKEENEEIEAA